MTKSTTFFYVLIILVSISQVCKFIFPVTFLKQFHLQSDHFIKWAVIQPIPSMYSYSNRAWISKYEYDSYTVQDIINRELELEGMQLNHYPSRTFTFRNDREKVLGKSVKTVYLRSEFAGESLISVYSIKNEQNKILIYNQNLYDGE